MKSVIKALMAASMLMPIAAQAQETGDRGPGGPGRRGDWNAPGGPRPDGGRPPLSADVGVEAQVRTERPQWRGERPDAPRPDRGPDRGQDRGQFNAVERGPDRGPDGRPDRGQNAGPGADWRRQDRPDGANNRRGNWRPEPSPAPVFDQRGPDQRRDWNQDRGDRGGQRDWQRRQDGERRWAEQQRGWNQGWNQRGGYDRRNGANRGWDRGWRNDRQYDWARERAANRGNFRLPRYYAPSGWGYGYRRFSVGVSLAPVLFSQSYWIEDPFAYRLPEAYGPYRWVRYYDDALLVDVRTGQVVDTVYDIFF